MSIANKTERSLLGHDDYQPVGATHHPAIYDLSRDELKSVRDRLRGMLEKERTQARHKRRESRGKGEPRGGNLTGNVEHAMQRKQVFASALKRANRELSRLEKIDARADNIEAAQRALAMRRAASFDKGPPRDNTADKGMQPIPSRRRVKTIPGSQIGSVTKQTARNQARRDARG